MSLMVIVLLPQETTTPTNMQEILEGAPALGDPSQRSMPVLRQCMSLPDNVQEELMEADLFPLTSKAAHAKVRLFSLIFLLPTPSPPPLTLLLLPLPLSLTLLHHLPLLHLLLLLLAGTVGRGSYCRQISNYQRTFSYFSSSTSSSLASPPASPSSPPSLDSHDRLIL